MPLTKTEHARLCSTAASRAKLCAELRAVAERCGATVEHTTNELIGRGSFEIIAKGGYRCQVEITAEKPGCRIGAFLGHWYTELDTDVKYDHAFASAIRGSINTHHFRKATICQDTWVDFLACVEAGLNRLPAPATAG